MTTYNIIFEYNNQVLYLETMYNFDTKQFQINLSEYESHATIFEFEIKNVTNGPNEIKIKHGPYYLTTNKLNNNIQLSEDKNNIQIFTLTDSDTLETEIDEHINGLELTKFNTLKWSVIEDNVIGGVYAKIKKYCIPLNILAKAEPINIIALGCIGDETYELKYLKSKINKRFRYITITPTLNHIFHSWKHAFSMYLGYSALNDSSTVKDLRYQIDHFLKGGHKINLYGHGYGGAIVLKALMINQPENSVGHFGYLPKQYYTNINTHIFGSYIMTSDTTIKQYVILDDMFIIQNNKLKQPNNSMLENFQIKQTENLTELDNSIRKGENLLEYESIADIQKTKSINSDTSDDDTIYNIYIDNLQNTNWIKLSTSNISTTSNETPIDKTLIYLNVMSDIINRT